MVALRRARSVVSPGHGSLGTWIVAVKRSGSTSDPSCVVLTVDSKPVCETAEVVGRDARRLRLQAPTCLPFVRSRPGAAPRFPAPDPAGRELAEPVAAYRRHVLAPPAVLLPATVGGLVMAGLACTDRQGMMPCRSHSAQKDALDHPLSGLVTNACDYREPDDCNIMVTSVTVD